MRPVPSIRHRTAAAMADFDSRFSPPSTLAAVPEQSPPPPRCDAQKCPWWPYSNSNDFKANTALILVVLFCALICALVFNAAIRYFIRRRQQTADDEKEDSRGFATEEAAEVPSLVYSDAVKLTVVETECIICLSEFATGDKVRVLEKCSHGFHLQCIQQWLVSHSSCPTCRTNCSIDCIKTES